MGRDPESPPRRPDEDGVVENRAQTNANATYPAAHQDQQSSLGASRNGSQNLDTVMGTRGASIPRRGSSRSVVNLGQNVLTTMSTSWHQQAQPGTKPYLLNSSARPSFDASSGQSLKGDNAPAAPASPAVQKSHGSGTASQRFRHLLHASSGGTTHDSGHVEDGLVSRASSVTRGSHRLPQHRTSLRNVFNGFSTSIKRHLSRTSLSTRHAAATAADGEEGGSRGMWLSSLEDFHALELIYHRGPHMTGYLARARHNRRYYLLKKYNTDSMSNEAVRGLRRAMQFGHTLHHDHLISLAGCWEDGEEEGEEAIWLVEEFAARGDLEQDFMTHPEQYTEQYVAAHVIQPLLLVLQHLHEHRICHRSLLPHHLLLGNRGTLLVGHTRTLLDMGVDRANVRGSDYLDYMAPEVVALKAAPADNILSGLTASASSPTAPRAAAAAAAGVGVGARRPSPRAPAAVAVAEGVEWFGGGERFGGACEGDGDPGVGADVWGARAMGPGSCSGGPTAAAAAAADTTSHGAAAAWCSSPSMGAAAPPAPAPSPSAAAAAAAASPGYPVAAAAAELEAPEDEDEAGERGAARQPGGGSPRAPPLSPPRVPLWYSRSGAAAAVAAAPEAVAEAAEGPSAAAAAAAAAGAMFQFQALGRQGSAGAGDGQLARGSEGLGWWRSQAQEQSGGSAAAAAAASPASPAAATAAAALVPPAAGSAGWVQTYSRPVPAVGGGAAGASSGIVSTIRRLWTKDSAASGGGAGGIGRLSRNSVETLVVEGADPEEGAGPGRGTGPGAGAPDPSQTNVHNQGPSARRASGTLLGRPSNVGSATSGGTGGRRSNEIRRSLDMLWRGMASGFTRSSGSVSGAQLASAEEGGGPGPGAGAGPGGAAGSRGRRSSSAFSGGGAAASRGRRSSGSVVSGGGRRSSVVNFFMMDAEAVQEEEDEGEEAGPLNTWECLECHDEKVDIWQVGCLVHELLCGCPPFDAPDPSLAAALILWADITVFPDHVSPQCVSFIQACLTKDPRSRPSAADLLHHQWITMHAPLEEPPTHKDKHSGLGSFRTSASHVILNGSGRSFTAATSRRSFTAGGAGGISSRFAAQLTGGGASAHHAPSAASPGGAGAPPDAAGSALDGAADGTGTPSSSSWWTLITGLFSHLTRGLRAVGDMMPDVTISGAKSGTEEAVAPVPGVEGALALRKDLYNACYVRGKHALALARVKGGAKVGRGAGAAAAAAAAGGATGGAAAAGSPKAESSGRVGPPLAAWTGQGPASPSAATGVVAGAAPRPGSATAAA